MVIMPDGPMGGSAADESSGKSVDRREAVQGLDRIVHDEPTASRDDAREPSTPS